MITTITCRVLSKRVYFFGRTSTEDKESGDPTRNEGDNMDNKMGGNIYSEGDKDSNDMNNES